MWRFLLLITIFSFFEMIFLPWQLSLAAESYLADVKRFAEAGDGESQFALALLYEYGSDALPRDREKAIRWLEKAGQAGIAGACLYLGIKFENGNGVQQDYSQAAHWYDCAARQDWPMAQFFLARLYREGKGVPQSLVTALSLLESAAEHGYPGAEESYAELLEILNSKHHPVLKEKEKR